MFHRLTLGMRFVSWDPFFSSAQRYLLQKHPGDQDHLLDGMQNVYIVGVYALYIALLLERSLVEKLE